MEFISKSDIKSEVEKIIAEINSIAYFNKKISEVKDVSLVRIEIKSEEIALLKLLQSLNIK